MAKGKKREKRPNYVGSKSELAKQKAEYERIHPNSKNKKKTVYLEDAPLVMFGVLFLWVVFLVTDYYIFNNLALMFPVTVMALALIALLHMASPKRWIKSRRYRRVVFYVLFFLIIAAITVLVAIIQKGYVIPLVNMG